MDTTKWPPPGNKIGLMTHISNNQYGMRFTIKQKWCFFFYLKANTEATQNYAETEVESSLEFYAMKINALLPWHGQAFFNNLCSTPFLLAHSD